MSLSPFCSSKSDQAPSLRELLSAHIFIWYDIIIMGVPMGGSMKSYQIKMCAESSSGRVGVGLRWVWGGLSVIIISRNLTLENSNSGERRSRNPDIPPSLSSGFSVFVDPGGPYGSAAGPLSHADGGPAVFRRGPPRNAVRALQRKERGQKVAHFRCFRRNML